MDIKKESKRILGICLASCLLAFNMNSFVNTAGLFPGGAMGLSLLIQRGVELIFHLSLPYTLINVTLNLIPIYIGFRFIGKKFTIYSCITIVLTSLLTDIFPQCMITSDVLLACIFGGIINGFAISICLRMNATTGGTDFISIYLSTKKGMDSWDIILGINVVILGVAGLLFGWDKSLYSIIFQFASTQVLHTMYKRYQQQTLLIVTDYPQKVYEVIASITNHSATCIKGEGTYKHQMKMVVYSVISREESKRVVKAIKKADPNAFINMLRSEGVAGWFYVKPNE